MEKNRKDGEHTELYYTIQKYLYYGEGMVQEIGIHGYARSLP